MSDLDYQLKDLISKRKNIDAKKYIEDNKINVKESDKYGNTYLHVAAEHTNYRMIEYLVNMGADVNASNKIKETPLWKAYGASGFEHTRNEATIRLLVELGADVTLVDRSGFSLYQMLVYNHFSTEIIDLVDKAATGFVDKTPVLDVINQLKKERVSKASQNIMFFSDGLKYQKQMVDSSEHLTEAEAICDEGVEYAKTGQFEKARSCFGRAAEMGLALAYGNLGLMYLRGHGIDKDYKISFDCFLKAAELGNVMAMDQVADMLRDGIGVSKSKKKSDLFRAKAQTYENYLAKGPRIQELLHQFNKNYLEIEENKLKHMCDEVMGLIPEPQDMYVETMEIYYILGSYFEKRGEFQTALIYYHMAEQVVGGKEYALLMYRIGSCCDTLGDERSARSYFKRAFRIAGNSIFEIDNDRYLKMVRH